jgi:hypothetical protein
LLLALLEKAGKVLEMQERF